MNKVNDIYNFIAVHKAFFMLAAAWCVREWSTVGGWNGLRNWLKTGKITATISTPAASPGADKNNETKTQ